PGPGGQNVNKVASAVQLRFNVRSSPSLPEEVRERLLVLVGNKLTINGELIIKASRHRTQRQNKQDALMRLWAFLRRAETRPQKRKKTKPSFSSTQTRIASKKRHAKIKSLRCKQVRDE
ncbi:MAG: alternative ribosome rescue aminoacyl-tRNA hydrolase ArfB, partial [Gammaproteobacteria bacterium]